MSEKKKTAKKAAAKTDSKAPKAPREKKPKEELVVFAIRLTPAERDAIHKASGPRNATQFVRRIAVAFAAEDEAAFRTVIKEARDLRA